MSNISDTINSKPILSICIATFKRGAFIGQTLDSIISQIRPNVEIVVVDGASPDNTSEVLSTYLAKYPFISYHRETDNSGVDADYDKCVTYAKGEYCWLMPDDDLMLDAAIEAVLEHCDGENQLIVANASVRDNALSKTFNQSLLGFDSNKLYSSESVNAFYSDCVRYLSFIGGVVVKRDFWQGRNRTQYYGTAFIHIGVLLQKPPPEKIYVIARPLIAIRYGNAMWKPQTFTIWMRNWPNLINSFEHIPTSVASKITQSNVLSMIKNLVVFRAQGYYGGTEYREIEGASPLSVRLIKFIISILPIKLTNALLAISLCLFKPNSKMLIYDLANCKYSTKVSKYLANKLGV